MQQHWLEWGPPVYMSVAAYMGLMKKPRSGNPSDDGGGQSLKADSEENLQNLEKLFSEFSGAGGVISA